MRYLLDTHTFLWFSTELERLSARVRNLIEDPDNEILLSYVSAWEIAIKVPLGRLRVPGHLPELIPRRLLDYGFAALPIELPHVLAVARLPLLHRDPFDRLLVCQAQIENLPILTGDGALAQYGVEVIW